jgi:hypothetical protein
MIKFDFRHNVMVHSRLGGGSKIFQKWERARESTCEYQVLKNYPFMIIGSKFGAVQTLNDLLTLGGWSRGRGPPL